GRMIRGAPLILLAGCIFGRIPDAEDDVDVVDVHSGTAVGNPGSVTVEIVPGSGASGIGGGFRPRRITLYPCEPREAQDLLVRDVLLGVPLADVIPNGTWCSLHVEAASMLRVDARLD